MSFNINLEKLHEKCRICLKEGDLDVWNCKVSFKRQPETSDDNFCVDDFIDKSFVEIMDIFSNSQDLLNFTDEFPLLCWQCLEDLKFCYIMYDRIKLANTQLKNLYEQSLNQCVEEEHLIEVADENEISEIRDTNPFETLKEKNILNLPQYEFDNVHELTILNKSNHSKQIIPDENDSFIVTQFIPETVDASDVCIPSEAKNNDDGLFQPPQHLLTMNLKAVEVKDLDSLELSQINADITESAIYICQYCPRAFAKADYLKTHIQKSHVCKFCTQAFSATEDLFRHIREIHTENKCAICYKMLSSQTNLRHHIKRVHRIKLPAKVTLIDFIKSTRLEENKMESLQELGPADIHLNASYMELYDDCIENLYENANAVIN